MTEKHLLNGFFKTLKNYPQNIAVKDQELGLSYKELYRVSYNLMIRMKNLGVKKNSLVGIYIDNSTDSTCSVLACVLAGYTFVPLNPEFPKDKLDQIIKEAGLSLILQQSQLQFDTNLADTLNIDLVDFVADPDLNYLPPEGDFVYVMFTSGTTGTPKGVPISHENIYYFIDWAMNKFDFKPTDRFSGHSRHSFDLSIFDIFCSIASGGCYYPLSSKDLINPAPFIRENELTVWFSVPSVINSLRANSELGKSFSSLRYLLFCGEALSVKNAFDIQNNNPQAKVHNLYGPTEATIACSSFEITESFLNNSPKDVPIGRPFSNVELIILNPETLEELKPNEKGALFILGKQLSSGYFKREALTKKSFINVNGEVAYDTGDLALLDEMGEIHWLARRDSQVKVNGYRIELLEIDHALSELEEVNEFASCVFQRGEMKTIQAHFTLNSLAEINKLKQKLKLKATEKLPGYMIPTQYYCWEELPKNSNGKIDRKSLASTFFKAKKL